MPRAAKPSAPKPTAAELDLLQALWALGAASAGDLHAHMQAQRPDITHATVLRLMQVMHGKGLLVRDETRRPHVYAPAQPQSALQGNLVKDLIDKAFGGSAKALVQAALRAPLAKGEREEIERLLRGDGN